MDTNIIKQHYDKFETASYIFDIDALIQHVLMIRKRLASNAKLCYAMKANPFLTKALEPFVDYFEVCSPGEFKICETLGIAMGKVVLSGVFKSEADINKTVSTYGSTITYTAESMRHWDLLCNASIKYNKPLNVYLRLTSGSQFGMSKADIIHICSTSKQHKHMNIVGIHYFVGTQRQSVSKYAREFQKLNTFMASLPEIDTSNLSLEYGPGLPIDYFQNETSHEHDMEDALYAALQTQASLFPTTVELGRYIAAHCGYYVTRVEDIKNCGESNIAIVNGGMHHVNYFGQSLAMKTPHYDHIAQHNTAETKCWNICGSLCTTSDILLKNQALQNLQIGDSFVFKNVGAYSVTESIALFLSRELPQIYFYTKENGFIKIREAIETHPFNMTKEI